ncbi:MAG: endonuclease domain-containing protein [Actinomycetota bacterium]
MLRKHHLPPPERQVPVWDRNRFVMRADFAYQPAKLIIEVEGFAFHSGRVQWEADRRKDLALGRIGYSIVRVTSRMLDEDELGFINAVKSHLMPTFFPS